MPDFDSRGTLPGNGRLQGKAPKPNRGTVGGGGGATTYFLMIGEDLNAAPTITHRTWLVDGTPDTDASRFSGPFSGGSPNIGEIAVLNTWQQ